MPTSKYLGACALAVVACAMASAAAAQTAPQPTPVTPNDPGRPAGQTQPGTASVTDTAQASGQAVADDRGDIVVTAQGRPQILGNVPVAVSAINDSQLRNSGANDIRQLNQLAPSLLVSSTGSEANGSVRIRGIGTVGDNPGLESSVAVLIDGVYRSRSGIGLNELGEIDRVEVLRGPQGTLGGRNSTAGLLSIISKAPNFNGISAGGEASYGNYNYYRLAGNLNVPLGETVAARVDGVYVKRDGFYRDTTNNTDVNDRDRYFLRGQLRFQPNSALDIRLIADYTYRNEKCCGAIYIDRSVSPTVGNLNEPVSSVNAGGTTTNANGNSIVNVLTDLGQPLASINQAGYSRNIAVSSGRTYGGITKDYGFSGQIDYDLGGVKLTSITAYRDYRSGQAGDVDYSAVDILYRAAPGYQREFKTFSQELRIQGKAFGGKLDWLVGGFFADERLRLDDNLKFGSQYGRFATCRAVSGGGLASFYSPTGQSCLSATGRAVVASGAATGGSAVLGSALLGAFDRLDTLNNLGSTDDIYRQKSRNYAFFTHNIFHITSTLDVTAGVRYTHESKSLNALFGNNNTVCPAQQAALTPFLPTLGATAVGLIGLSCQGNSSAELNGVAIADSRSEHKFTGTAILSWKPVDHLLTYASYSRGYKAGGFNLDRSALKAPTATFASLGGGNAQAGAQSLVGNLQFAPEVVNAYEIGAKYTTGPFSLSIAAFRQDFSNFQLNTFDGSVFIVQNINGCSASLSGADRDQSKFVGAPNYSAAAATTGACAAGNVGYGVRAQGVELEASLVPYRDLRVTLGATIADTKYRDNLVGTSAGAPLNQALRMLPGSRLSNSAEYVVTGSTAFTPKIGSSGWSALFYIDGRLTSDYNTGSDLFPQKAQDGYFVANARVGIRGPSERWAVEFWGQNIFNKQYAQVAFNTPFQEGATSTNAAFADPQYPGGRQLFSQFLAEPRTYGVTLRGRF